MLNGLNGPRWLAESREQGLERFGSLSLPTSRQEIWRYSPIDELELAGYRPLTTGPVPAAASGAAAGLPSAAGPEVPGVRLVVRDGWLVEAPPALPGVSISALSARGDGPELWRLFAAAGDDPFDALHQAFSPDTIVIDVGAGVVVERPLVVEHLIGGADGAGAGAGAAADAGAGAGRSKPAVFPGLLVRLGDGAQLRLVERLVSTGPGGGLIVPRTVLRIGDAANLAYASLQLLDDAAWHLGRLSAEVGRDASLRSFTAGLGGDYDRLETNVEITGRGGGSELRSVYLGSGHQVHDMRTLQDHVAPSTTSDLVCKGAVTGSSRSIYTGLIRIRPGAVGTDALQSNYNLVLGEHAHADSIPNLDIEENEVRCSHASSVGPVDEDQLYYLEARGIAPERAERLIVLGFFGEIIDRSPVPEARAALHHTVVERVTTSLADPADPLPERDRQRTEEVPA